MNYMIWIVLWVGDLLCLGCIFGYYVAGGEGVLVCSGGKVEMGYRW